MFQRIIYNVIRCIKGLYDNLDAAYQQTYTDSKVSEDANNEIKKRKDSNRQNTIAKITQFIINEYHKDTGGNMPEEVAYQFAKEFYATAKIRGHIDEMNNFIGEIGWEK